MVTNTFQNLLYKNKLYEDNPTFANKCLKVRVQGKGAGYNNRSGFGAKVRVYNPSETVLYGMREIASGPEPAIAYFALPQSGTYTIQVTFLKNGALPPQTISLINITVPRDTVVIQP